MFFKKNNVSSKNNGGFREHLPKILSVAAAIILWFYVVDMQTTVEQKTIAGVSVIIENLDESNGLKVFSGKDHKIEVTISGTKNDLADISHKDIVAIADMSGIDSDGYHYPDINITVPSGVSVINRSASEVPIYVDKLVTKNVDIHVEFLYDKLNPGYEVGQPLISFGSNDLPTSTASVQVSGPQRVVDTIYRLKAQLHTEEIKNTFSSQLSLVPVDEKFTAISSPYITLKKTSATVTIPVYKTVSVSVTPDFDDNDNDSIKYRVEPEVITIKGEPSVVDEIPTIYTTPIHATGVSQSVQSLVLPDGVTSDSVKTVNVFIEEIIEIVDPSDIISAEIPVSYELSYSNKLNPEAYEITEDIGDVKTVVVTGPKRVVSMIEELKAQYNFNIISDTNTDSYSASCPLIPVDADGNVVSTTYLKLETDSVEVKLNVSKKIRVGVRPVFANSTAKIDYTMSENVVLIKGTISDVAEIEFAETEAVDAKTSGEYSVKLNLPQSVSVFDLNGNEIESIKIKVNKVS